MKKIEKKPRFDINKLERYSFEKGKIAKNVARIMFNWPEYANGQDYRSVNELNDILDEVGKDDEIDVVILTGTGRWWSGGAAIKNPYGGWEYDYDGIGYDKLDVLDKDPEKYLLGERAEIENCMRILRMPQIVIGAINGACIGMTTDIAAACDFRIASENAFFGVNQVVLGVQCLSGYALFPPLVGLSQAKRLYLHGPLLFPDYVRAKEAREIGLVDEVVPADKFVERVELVARDIAAIPRQTTRLIKETFNLPLIASLEESSHRSNLGQIWLRGLGFRESHRRASQILLEKYRGAGRKAVAQK